MLQGLSGLWCAEGAKNAHNRRILRAASAGGVGQSQPRFASVSPTLRGAVRDSKDTTFVLSRGRPEVVRRDRKRLATIMWFSSDPRTTWYQARLTLGYGIR